MEAKKNNITKRPESTNEVPADKNTTEDNIANRLSGMNETPSGDRTVIGFFGRRNVGKSSVVNAVTGQQIAVVSEVKGTTTDPVQKAMELLPLGPVLIIDTPGIDDTGSLGEKRVQQTRKVLNRTDVAVLVADATSGLTPADHELVALFRAKTTPCIIAYNKSDLLPEAPATTPVIPGGFRNPSPSDSTVPGSSAMPAPVDSTPPNPSVPVSIPTEPLPALIPATSGSSAMPTPVGSTPLHLSPVLTTPGGSTPLRPSPVPGAPPVHEIFVSAITGAGITELKEQIAALGKASVGGEKYPLVSDLISPGDFALLVVPIDSAAPKGRLILPQQQVIRDVLESDATAVVVKEHELADTLKSLGKKPSIVITDSQAFAKVSADTPQDIPLTSFSILFARYKGDLAQNVKGVRALDKICNDDKILICEGCTHHRQCDDIGTVKLPRWIENHTKAKPKFEFTSGGDFPTDIGSYKLIVHCGGCMLNEREMKYRLAQAKDAGIPMTNYGIAIAYMNGILPRSLGVFPEILSEIYCSDN